MLVLEPCWSQFFCPNPTILIFSILYFIPSLFVIVIIDLIKIIYITEIVAKKCLKHVLSSRSLKIIIQSWTLNVIKQRTEIRGREFIFLYLLLCTVVSLVISLMLPRALPAIIRKSFTEREKNMWLGDNADHTFPQYLARSETVNLYVYCPSGGGWSVALVNSASETGLRKKLGMSSSILPMRCRNKRSNSTKVICTFVLCSR